MSGELAELKADLNDPKKEKKKEAVKKIIANMTVGKDVRLVYLSCDITMWRVFITNQNFYKARVSFRSNVSLWLMV